MKCEFCDLPDIRKHETETGVCAYHAVLISIVTHAQESGMELEDAQGFAFHVLSEFLQLDRDRVIAEVYEGLVKTGSETSFCN